MEEDLGVNEPMVTVFIPCYNAERFISETIDSILNQTYQDFELLIIDDGSTDNSREILSNYAQKDERIRILYNNGNKGVAYTRNRGIKEARGRYLATMDADDIATPFRLEKEVQYLNEHKWIGAVSGCLYMIDEKGKKLRRSPLVFYEAQEVKARTFFENVVVNSASMYRLDIVRKNNIKYKDNYHGVEDYMFWCMLLNYTKIVVLNEYFVFYRIVNSGLTVTNRRKCNKERLTCINEIHQYMLKSNGFHINKMLSNYCVPQYADSFSKGEIKSISIMCIFFMHILLQAKIMKKEYYSELKMYISTVIKRWWK